MLVAGVSTTLQRTATANTPMHLNCWFRDPTAADMSEMSFFGGTNEIMKEIIGRSLGL
jgi:hypothetical protein